MNPGKPGRAAHEKSDGSKVEVHLDSSYNVMPGRGGHGDPPDGGPPNGGYVG